MPPPQRPLQQGCRASATHASHRSFPRATQSPKLAPQAAGKSTIGVATTSLHPRALLRSGEDCMSEGVLHNQGNQHNVGQTAAGGKRHEGHGNAQRQNMTQVRRAVMPQGRKATGEARPTRSMMWKPWPLRRKTLQRLRNTRTHPHTHKGPNKPLEKSNPKPSSTTQRLDDASILDATCANAAAHPRPPGNGAAARATPTKTRAGLCGTKPSNGACTRSGLCFEWLATATGTLCALIGTPPNTSAANQGRDQG